MVIYDKSIGDILSVINYVGFGYYFIWLLVTPFIDSSHFTQNLFPPKEYAIAIPAIIVTTLVTVLFTAAGIHLMLRTGKDVVK